MLRASVILVALTLPLAAQAQSFQNSPSNFRNSEANFQNSPGNFRNSPSNYQNSPINPQGNGIYDNAGNYQGYAVPRSDGGLNIFSPSGNRTGYRPGNDED